MHVLVGFSPTLKADVELGGQIVVCSVTHGRHWLAMRVISAYPPMMPAEFDMIPASRPFR
jgi:hypothetical protein